LEAAPSQRNKGVFVVWREVAFLGRERIEVATDLQDE
jgi:hypothetical protein